MSDEQGAEYPWVALVPKGYDPVRAGYTTQEGDLQMLYDGKWADVDNIGSVVRYFSSPVCRPRTRKFYVAVSEGDSRTSSDFASTGDVFRIDTHGRLIRVIKAEAE